MALTRRAPRLGLALGSGSARGWAHIGVLQALREEGVRLDVICGSSIGALVGAAYAGGELERFADWVQGLGLRDVFGFMDFNLSGGMLKGEKLIAFWRRNFADFDIDASPLPFGAVATDLHSGAEVWLRHGSIADAVRASIALPGLFTPVNHTDGRLLVDGGLVNPVPASLARAMGADIVIAVDLNSDVVGAAWRNHHKDGKAEPPVDAPVAWHRKLLSRFGRGGAPDAAGEPAEAESLPSMLTVMQSSIAIMSVRIARSRLAGEPADVLISPRLAQLGLMDYHRGAEAIAEGEAAVELALPAIRRALGR